MGVAVGPEGQRVPESEDHMNRPGFVDAALVAAFEAAEPALAAHSAALVYMAADIRALEEYLVRHAVFVRAEAHVPGTNEEIAWMPGPDHRWHVTFVVRRLSQTTQRTTLDSMGPLIEAPLDIRRRARPALPELVKAIAAAVSGTEG